MTDMLKRAREVIKAYGADPERWPDDERVNLQAFVEGNPEVSDLIDEARDLDEALASARQPVVAPSALKASLLVQAKAMMSEQTTAPNRQAVTTGQTSLLARLSRLFEPDRYFQGAAMATMVVSCLALGIWFGAFMTTAAPLAEEDLLAAFGEDYGLFDEDDLDLSFEETGERL